MGLPSRDLSEDEGWGSLGAGTVALLPTHIEHCLGTQPLLPSWIECHTQHGIQS